MKQPETARYVEPLKEVVLARLFGQLGQVYDSLHLDRAIRLGTFSSEAEDPAKARSRIERFIAGACRRGDLDVTFDHAGASILFDQDLFGSAAGPSTISDTDRSILQPSPAILLRTQLSRLATCLYSTLDHINPQTSPQSEAVHVREEAIKLMAKQLAAERSALLKRKRVFEKRKDESDVQAARKEQEEQHARLIRIQAKADELARKEKEDVRKREIEKIQKQNAEQKRQEAKAMAQSIAQRTGIDIKIAVSFLLSNIT